MTFMIVEIVYAIYLIIKIKGTKK